MGVSPAEPEAINTAGECVRYHDATLWGRFAYLALRGWPGRTFGQGSQAVGIRRYFVKGATAGLIRLKSKFGGMVAC